MEFICICIITVVLSVVLTIVFNINIKEVKEVAKNPELDKLTQKYPENIQICKDILKKINNNNVKIEEDKETKNCLYIVANNKILIADTKQSFLRIQTIAHECLHSIQNKRILMFNFIYSNIYLLYLLVVVILGILKKIPDEMLFLNIFILLGLVYYAVRIYLENDAMIKAKYLAKEYMEEKQICTQEEVAKIIEGFDKINNLGIKGTNYSLLLGVLTKTLLLSIIFAIF